MKPICLLLFSLVLSVPNFSQDRVEDLVHTRTGTQNEGQTYPAVGVPFAMTQWTPQTRAGERKGVAPYYFSDQRIQGIRASHFLSGSAVPDYGTITLMAGTGKLKTEATERSSAFDHSSEHASPYSYSVELIDAHMIASVAGTLRSGILRFTFTQDSDDAWVVLENNSRAGEGTVQVSADGNQLLAQVPIRREYAGSGRSAGFSAWFVIEIDRRASAFGTFICKTAKDRAERQDGDGKPAGVIAFPGTMTTAGGATAAAMNTSAAAPRPGFGVFVHFGKVLKGETIYARVGSSFVSFAQAQKNLRAEIPDWGFSRVEDAGRRAWHAELSRIEISGHDPAKAVFYTAIYHVLLQPRTYSDVDGSYPRFHNHGSTEYVEGNQVQYDDFSI